MQLKKSNSATHFCKVCFKPIQMNSLRYFIGEKLEICRSCYEDLRPKFIRYRTSGVKCLSLYYYDDKIQSLIYLFKGAYDYELRHIFISYCLPLLKFYYHGFYLLPVPSSKEKNEARGYNQVIEIFRSLNLPYIYAIRKTCDHVQHEGNTVQRKMVKNYLAWNEKADVEGKKILLVDDVYTTGSTVKACLAMIKKHNPKLIRVLTIAKTRDIDDR